MLHIKPHFEDFQTKRLLVVDCLPGESPVYLKNGASEEFYIRAGASSAALSASEMTTYIHQRYA
jgi:predicted HTH transcriptional regulator